MNCLSGAISLILDIRFGEIKSLTHPVVYFGRFISWYEKKLYFDSKISGLFLLIALILIAQIVVNIILLLPFYSIISIIFGWIFLASNLLKSSVLEVINSKNQKEALSKIVSRDVDELNEEQIISSAIESYSENLSDGVVAPLFYFVLFGLSGIVIYKVVNTLDSMVGYKNKRYKNFGFFSAKLDDLLNLIPSRLTALLMLIVSNKIGKIKLLLKEAKKSSSPNAGYPIAAASLILEVRLAGPVKYFGKLANKPYFNELAKKPSKSEVKKIIEIGKRVEYLIIGVLIGCSII
jgi:adenosylcobinamide-phosphate synthase